MNGNLRLENTNRQLIIYLCCDQSLINKNFKKLNVMKKQFQAMMAVAATILLATTFANAQWTTTAGVVHPVTLTNNVSVGTNINGANLYVEKSTAVTLGIKSTTAGATMFMDKGSVTANAAFAYKFAGAVQWNTGMLGNNNYSVRYVPSNNFPLVITGNGYVSIGNLAAGGNYKLDVQGPPTSNSFYTINAQTNYLGTLDIRGVHAVSKCADGYGIGVEGIGGYMGLYGNADGGAYTGTSYGVYGYATGTAGYRYGVYGYASNSGGPAYAGYFAGNTYAANMMVNASTPATGYTLTVGGKIICTEVRVQLTPFPDYVFSKNYNLNTIEQVEEHIKQYNHLPGMPPACEVEEGGMAVGEMQGKIIEKVEEQALYIIQLNNKIKELEKKIEAIQLK